MAKIKFEDIDVSTLSRIELMRLSSMAETQLRVTEESDRQAARDAIEAVIDEHGYDWADLYEGGKPKAKRAAYGSRQTQNKFRAKTGVKYAHPDNPNMTWVGGRGSRDPWVKELLSEGREPVVVEE